MRALLSLFTVALLGSATPALADAGSTCHFHGNKPAAADVVIGCAQDRKAQLIKAGKIDATWQSIKENNAEQVDGKKGKEWKVTFTNPAAKDPSKATLYVFFTLPGNFIAANFTGK